MNCNPPPCLAQLILRGRKSENAPRYDDDDAGVAVVREASAVKGAGI